MKESFEDFKKFLPQYLSTDAQTKLFEALEQFPKNIDSRFYTTKLQNEQNIYQGDGLPSLWVTDLPSEKIGKARVMVLSNSCDIAPGNKSLVGQRLIYCPIISISKLMALLQASEATKNVEPNSYLTNVRKQHISTMFYLPSIGRLGEESVALFDRINNCDAQAISVDEMVKTRLFTLSDYGFYVFLFKLSIHLTRIRENVERN